MQSLTYNVHGVFTRSPIYDRSARYAIVMYVRPSVRPYARMYVTKSARGAEAAPWVAQLSFLARLKGQFLQFNLA